MFSSKYTLKSNKEMSKFVIKCDETGSPVIPLAFCKPVEEDWAEMSNATKDAELREKDKEIKELNEQIMMFKHLLENASYGCQYWRKKAEENENDLKVVNGQTGIMSQFLEISAQEHKKKDEKIKEITQENEQLKQLLEYSRSAADHWKGLYTILTE